MNYIIRFFFLLKICLFKKKREAVLRWLRNRTGRPVSPPQIHQKNIWTLSKFHETTSECQKRTSGTQKNSTLSSKVGRKKYKRQKERQKSRDRAPSREGSLKKERSFQTPGNTLTPESVASLGTTEGNIIGRENK